MQILTNFWLFGVEILFRYIHKKLKLQNFAFFVSTVFKIVPQFFFILSYKEPL